ncbi:MAG: glycosyltransferase [Myxococcota bacterium]
MGGQTLFVRGVTYGTFRPGPDRAEYPDRVAVEKDFSLMATHGINAVRTYTVPPLWLLDVAEQHGLLVLVGLPMERYVGYLNDRRAPDIAEIVRSGVRSCAEHPAVLAYSLANEIPAPIVRWHGRRRMERFLEGLYHAAKDEDPNGLVTYVTYPSTEYLDLPFLDLVSMNVYLEAREKLEGYLARVQNLAGERPLLLAEVGLDSLRNGEGTQADTIDWQLRSAFAEGCAGAFVYSWTDEWHRGGEDVLDWEFGVTRRDRRPKPALRALTRAFADVPLPSERRKPRISVVVCSYNGSRTIRECLEGVSRIDYPNYEILVVDDGSTDSTAQIAGEFDVRLIRTPQRGLSNARNTGMRAASGEIVAYLDDDAWPDPNWLTYLAETFERTGCAAAGGPNVSPPGDGFVASCVNDAPGNPTHVLLSDREAEHLPGCNLAIRVDRLRAIGGFDSRFRCAGDDVDVCWRLRDQGGSLAFHPAALVWHHRRGSLRTFWKQQRGYGRSEAMLEAKWPEKYNGAGHLSWNGRVYGGVPLLGRTRIYHGVWGSAPFQSIYGPAERSPFVYALTPEWHIAVLGLVALALLGLSWTPLLLAAPVAGLMAATSLLRAACLAARTSGVRKERSGVRRLGRFALTAFLHLFQPVARTVGRLANGLTPWRRGRGRKLGSPRPRRIALWTETWGESADRLSALVSRLQGAGFTVLHGGPYDRFDLEIRSGVLGCARLLMAVEEHGGGCQLVRLRVWPRVARGALTLTVALLALALGASWAQSWPAAATLGVAAGLGLLRMGFDCASAAGAARNAIDEYADGESLRPIVSPARQPE